MSVIYSSGNNFYPPPKTDDSVTIITITGFNVSSYVYVHMDGVFCMIAVPKDNRCIEFLWHLQEIGRHRMRVLGAEPGSSEIVVCVLNCCVISAVPETTFQLTKVRLG